MYDAKKREKEEKEEESLRCNCVSDRSYFNNAAKTDTMMSYKTSYIPIDTLL